MLNLLMIQTQTEEKNIENWLKNEKRLKNGKKLNNYENSSPII